MISITTDQGSNIKKAASELPFKSSVCYAHLLQNCIKEAFSGSKKRKIPQNDSIVRIIEKSREICRKIRKSPKYQLMLQEHLNMLGIKYKKIKLDIVTRWDSTYMMIERLLQLKDGVGSVLSKLFTEKNRISEQKKKES